MYASFTVAPQQIVPCFSSRIARALRVRRERLGHLREIGKPGRRYGERDDVVAVHLRGARPGARSLLVSETTASAWVWITAEAGRKPCSSVSMDGRGLAGSCSACAR